MVANGSGFNFMTADSGTNVISTNTGFNNISGVTAINTSTTDTTFIGGSQNSTFITSGFAGVNLQSNVITYETRDNNNVSLGADSIKKGISVALSANLDIDSGSNIESRFTFSSSVFGQVIKCLVVNKSNSNVTFTASGGGITLNDASMVVSPHTSRLLYFQRTAVNAFTVF
jgi:hypothetical protein